MSLPAADYYDLAAQTLALCAELGDRFALLDVPGGDVTGFRDGIGPDHLTYGAAYHPYLVTTFPHVTSVEQASEKHLVVLPPSAAVAGICARTDRERGVWQPPANQAVYEVMGPLTRLTIAEQDLLEADPQAGQAINALREFTGRGTLVWGARTLGGDGEWRYVSVRRLFLDVEHSIDVATRFVVFEPNVEATWARVRTVIGDYLHSLWQQGAVEGSTPDQAYFVRVGLGQTMTEQDLLDGRLVIEVGLAPLRPAEFVVLRVSHQLEQP